MNTALWIVQGLVAAAFVAWGRFGDYSLEKVRRRASSDLRHPDIDRGRESEGRETFGDSGGMVVDGVVGQRTGTDRALERPGPGLVGNTRSEVRMASVPAATRWTRVRLHRSFSLPLWKCHRPAVTGS